jgi:hypothetical protein
LAEGKTDLDFLPVGFDFVATGFDFVAVDLDFVVVGLDFLPHGRPQLNSSVVSIHNTHPH